MTAVPTVSPEIPEELVSIGVILGVLTPPNGTPPELNTSWFADPISQMSGVLTDAGRRQALLDFAEDLLGTATDDLDLPDIDPTEESWIPLVTTGAPPTTGGLFAIIDMRSGTPVISLGARAAITHNDLVASLTLRVPLVEAGVGGLDVLLGSDGGDIEVAVNLTLPDLGLDGVVNLAGASFAAVLPTDGSDPSLTVVLKGLQLPGDPAPADFALGELLDDLGSEALQILIGLLRSQTDLADEVEDLLALIGLDPTSPIPELPIVDVIQHGVVALRAWVSDVVDQALDNWLQRLADFLGVAAVAGTGTTADPYRICFDDPPIEACLTLEVSTDTQTGAVTLIPGASVEIAAPAASTVSGNLSAAISFATLVLNHGLTVSAGPSLRAFGELGDGNLVDTAVDGFDIEVGLLRAGITFPAGGSVEPMVEAVDVTIGTDRYPVLDLTSVDAVTEAAAGALGDVVDHLLGLLGVDDIRQAEALAVLAGLRAPTGAPADWPATVGLAAFFSDPVGAIGCYHANVLGQPGRWSRLAEELGVVLAAAGTPAIAVAGTGTEADPWAVTLFDNVGDGDPVEGTARLVAWSGVAAGAGPTLHVGFDILPALADLGGTAITLRQRIELLRVGLPPADTCPGPVTTIWTPSHFTLLRLEPVDVDVAPIRLTADAVEFGARSDRATGFGPIIRADGLTFMIDGTDFDLGDFSLADLVDLTAFNNLPWDGIQLVLADWLGDLDVDS
ncbi:MAG: hypothetical protein OES24_23595, partial [Acidimicrobiia bacterium]|nr:hypothetical protein [Acidimicrobiia bacterium]